MKLVRSPICNAARLCFS